MNAGNKKCRMRIRLFLFISYDIIIFMKVLFVDNYDSFSDTIIYYFANIGIYCDRITNDSDFEEKNVKDYDGLVLSPGPGNTDNSGNCDTILDYFAGKRPVLGICLGHQVIGVHYAGVLNRKIIPFHGLLRSVIFKKSPLFEGFSGNMLMTCYNSLTLDNINHNILKITAYDEEDGSIMALQHRYLPVYGIQFHPESFMSQDGMAIFRNFAHIMKRYGEKYAEQ